MTYTIEHIDDIHVLYNGNGNHDKVYIVVVCRNNEWPEQWYVKGLYKPRTRKRYNLSNISQANFKIKAVSSAASTVLEKIRKGYLELTDDSQNGFMGFPSTKAELLNELQTLLSGGQPSENTRLEEYECIDDLGIRGKFIPGMHYMGNTDEKNRLHMVNDDGKSVIVDPDNFQKIQQTIE